MNWPVNNDAILRSVHELFDSGKWWLYKGEAVRAFEQRFAEAHDTTHGVSVCNGTVPLDIILRGLGIGAGDRVVLPAYDFYSLPKSVSNVGAAPVFADVSMLNPCIDVSEARRAVEAGARAVVAVHISGSVAELDALRAMCDELGAYLIEDCAQGTGASYGGKRVGSWGHAGLFSFGGVKLMTCGQGGMITTSDPELYEKCYAIANRGRLPGGTLNPYGIIGDNYQMSELSAAILNPQLDILDDLCAQRESIMDSIDEAIAQIEGLSPLSQFEKTTCRAQMRHAFLYDSPRMPRDEFIQSACKAGIPLMGGYESVKDTPQLFHAYGDDRDYPAARHAQESILSIHHTDILRGADYWEEAVGRLQEIL